jgi:hypothetical protein
MVLGYGDPMTGVYRRADGFWELMTGDGFNGWTFWAKKMKRGTRLGTDRIEAEILDESIPVVPWKALLAGGKSSERQRQEIMRNPRLAVPGQVQHCLGGNGSTCLGRIVDRR